jgi:hypothetical protein
MLMPDLPAFSTGLDEAELEPLRRLAEPDEHRVVAKLSSIFDLATMIATTSP